MNSKLQFERHLQLTAVILLRQSHGFVVLIIPCYHAGTNKEANINNRTGRLRTVLFKYFISASLMHSSMRYQCIHQCIINASSMHSSLHLSMHPQCTINTSSMYSLHQMHQFRSFSSSFIISASSVHRQYIYQCITNVLINVFFNASSTQSINASSMRFQCFNNASSMLH